MMGQLCPPAMLVALSLLEGMFFWQHGLRCISFSYAQQTHAGQDLEAIAALHTLIGRYVPDARTHVVLYTYMGMYPRTHDGALRLLGESARLAARSGAGRLIVKTSAEAHRLPTIAENVAALEHAAAAARETTAAYQTEAAAPEATGTGICEQAKALVDNVLSLDDDIGRALVTAFARGHLDVPFCLHPDNPGRVRGYLDPGGLLLWERIGSLPLAGVVDLPSAGRTTSASLLAALRYMERKFDGQGRRTQVTLAGSTR
jgi:methylaspartate mutase epsilon subunit